MNSIIENIFNEYGFVCIKTDVYENVDFYIPSNDKADFFMIYYVDFSNTDLSSKDISAELDSLQKRYIENDECLYIVLNENDNFKRQLKKNLSAIYLVKIADMKDLTKIRNTIYALEESPYYFKRYVLVYTESQVDLFKNFMKTNNHTSVNSAINLYINNDKEYKSFLKKEDNNSLYAFALRIFSKLHFTKYNFQNISEQISINQSILNNLSEQNLMKYYEILIGNKSSDYDEVVKRVVADTELSGDDHSSIEKTILSINEV